MNLAKEKNAYEEQTEGKYLSKTYFSRGGGYMYSSGGRGGLVPPRDNRLNTTSPPPSPLAALV
jgi:hypothetical protein